MKNLLLLILITLTLYSNDEISQAMVKKEFLIGKSTSSYDEAKSFAIKISKSLNMKLDFRGLSFNKKSFLTFPRKDCDELSEYPCYFSRGRYDDGEYISIEHSSAYSEMKEGYYIVVLATDENVSKTLTKVKKEIPDAYIKSVDIYMGCMH